MFLEYWFAVGLLYYKAVSGLVDDLTGVWVECSARFVSLVLLDQDLITQFDAGGIGLRCMQSSKALLLQRIQVERLTTSVIAFVITVDWFLCEANWQTLLGGG